MTIRNALLAATVIGLPAAANAQPVSGLYVGAGAMANFLQDQSIKGLSAPGLPDTLSGSHAKYDVGWGSVASVGWGFGNGLRLELEGNYRSNTLRAFTLPSPALAPSGQEEKYGAMVNALYDFSFRDIGLSMLGLDAVNPYVGVGVGWAHSTWSGVAVPFGTGPGYSSLRVNSGNDTFAYQVIAGLSFPIYSVLPGLSLTAEYRFYSTPNDRKYASQLIAPGIPSASHIKVADDFNHSILVGLRYAFNVPSPPPPPAPAPVTAPAPEPPRTYLVFFDWDRADLTPRARQIIAEAAANVSRVQVTRIEVNGYTDLSGPAAYNQRLSVRRAEAVAGELVRDGVPRSIITAQGFGMSNPLVPTALGVREPQNRRVEIILK